MRPLLATLVFLGLGVVPLPCQDPLTSPPQRLPGSARDSDPKLPDGKSQTEAILKSEYEKNLKDAADLAELSRSLQESLQKNTQHVMSLTDLKKTEEIEKLARRIRARIRHF